MQLQTRRDTLKFLCRALPGVTVAASPELRALFAGEAVAAPRGAKPPYGAAINPYALAMPDEAPAYKAAVRKYCRLAMCEGGFNWEHTRPGPGRFDYGQFAANLDFCLASGLRVRGGGLVWYGAMAKWPDATISNAREAERALVEHIERIIGDFGGRIRDWLVVNEPIDERVPAGGGAALRPSVWQRHLGERYIDIAFRTVAQIDPTLRLSINEYHVEGRTEAQARKRAAYLGLIRRLVDRGVPVHDVGLQSHLDGLIPIDRDGVIGFCDAVKRMGLDVLVSELDVVDQKLPPDVETRDAAVALRAYEMLDAVTAAVVPREVMTWGLVDTFTWVPMYFKRADGLANRPLPLDRAYRPKPLMRVIERFCDTAAY